MMKSTNYLLCLPLVLWTWMNVRVIACGGETEEAPPFTVYWNVPSHVCQRHGIYINASKFGIVQNKGDIFHGDKVDINYHPGKFPYIHGNDSVYGGIPQRGNLQSHTITFWNQVEAMPPDFSGPAVLDFEYYLPSFFEAPREYRRASKDWVQSLHPNWTAEEVEEEAINTFNTSSKEFMEKLLQIATKLRPNALWGYYHYPYCKNREGKLNCSDIMLAVNDDLVPWLYNASKALYPSIYVQKWKGFDEQGRKNLAVGRINEALRIRRQLSKSIPIFTYFRGKYKDTKEFLEKVDIVNTIGISRLEGIDGSIIWGSSEDVSSAEKCKTFQENLETTLGPLVHDIITMDLPDLRRAFRFQKLQKHLMEKSYRRDGYRPKYTFHL